VVGVVGTLRPSRWATLGGGSWVNDSAAEPRRIRVSQVASLADASLSYSDTQWVPSSLQSRWDDLRHAAWRNRAYGDFWSHLLVAEGAVDIAAEPELNLSDVAGVAIIVTEAGGRFTGVDGVDGPAQGSKGPATRGLSRTRCSPSSPVTV
jgi:histidinol-phosphatase